MPAELSNESWEATVEEQRDRVAKQIEHVLDYKDTILDRVAQRNEELGDMQQQNHGMVKEIEELKH